MLPRRVIEKSRRRSRSRNSNFRILSGYSDDAGKAEAHAMADDALRKDECEAMDGCAADVGGRLLQG